MLLPAATPAAWLDTHLLRSFSTYVEATREGVPHRSLGVDEVLADDALVLRELRDLLTAEGATPRAAATNLAGWFGGLAATALGYAFVGSGAGFLVNPATIRWMVHPDGWSDAVELGDVTSVVPPGHPWSGLANVLVIDDVIERRARVAAALVEAVRPVIDACHGLARVGKAGMWNEVGDGFASALVYQATIPVTEPDVEAMRALIATPGVPWKARATLRVVTTDHGRVCVMQKGGCCLVFTGDYDHDDEELDDDRRAYRDRFSDPPGAPNYCVNCPRRDFADCQARQLWWRARELERGVV
jgi:hypothetical protein